jgi:UDP-galactopyranose mutase
LPYRSLRFEHTHHENCDSWQSVGTVNYPNDHPYTRITEMKKITGQQSTGTSLVTEYPSAEGDPYYPIPRQENQDLFRKYAEMAEQEKNVSFTGRLAEYKYYNMDQVVASALILATKLINAMEYDNHPMEPEVA